MKLLWFALSVGLVAAGPLAAAQPHRHQHRHAEKRAPGTKTEYILNGTPVPYGDVQKGLAEGTLVIVGGRIEPASSPAEATSTPSSTLSSSSMSISSATSTTGSVAVETPTPTSKSESGSGEQLEYKAPETKSYTPSSSSGSFSGGEGVDRDFPDGEIDCSHFPSEYGAIALEHLKLGGWTGLQDVTFSDDGASITTIHTMKSGPCADGMMCSYACPPGYEKGQWPKEQGSTGQSVGGIQCKGGKLHLPGGGNSPKLCVKGAGGVKVHNTVGESIAICRTDYPGTESMVIPTTPNSASSEPYDLTCPISAKTYHQQGVKTSAQYYVNKKGVSIEDGCKWGDGGDKGNWAPMIVGVSENDGVWLSIFQNKPMQADVKPNFKVEIIGDDLSCKCRYEDGNYYRDDQRMEDEGCTVKVNSGEATFKFS